MIKERLPKSYDFKIVLAAKMTKYTKRTMKKTRAYIQDCLQKGKTPFIEELALKFGVSDRTVYNWAHGVGKHEEFTELYEILKTVQKLDIKKRSLVGEYENPIAKLILSAEHNVVERYKKEVSGVDGEPIQVESNVTPEARKQYAEEITKIFENMNSK